MTREDAIEIVQSATVWTDEERDALAMLIPELAESEDERIRQFLLRLVKRCPENSIDFMGEIKKGDVIAYLEKQKDLDKMIVVSPEVWDKAIADAYENGKKDGKKQKEQKPAWSEEDKVMLNSIIWGVHMKSITPLDEMEDRNKYEKYEDFLKSLPERFILQPKQEQQIKEGDKVSIHCRKDRREDITITYDGEVGEVIHVWDAKKHPWGHIIVQLNNGCNTGFYEDELEVLDEPSWKPSEERPKMNIPSAGSGAMGTTSPKFKLDVKQDLPVGLEKEIQEYLEKLGGGHGGFVDNLIDDDLTGLALHFYALGLKARKEGK